MLVVISDLHLNDGSAAPENISPKAFAIWMEEVLALARRNRARELVFLYLGDMVDLLRTEYWFYPEPGAPLGAQAAESFPLEHRPWGDRHINQHPEQLSEPCRARALAILRRICHVAREQLAYLNGEADEAKRRLADLGIPIRRIYIPGNHDRLLWVDPAVREGILQAFASDMVAGPRPFEIHLPEYGLLARHGHQWDPWNYEACDERGRPAAFTTGEHKLVPIGDPVTTELLARLPYLVAANLPASLSDNVRAQVYGQLRHLEDVRPLSQALRWVMVEPANAVAGYDEPTRTVMLDTLQAMARRLIADFMKIPFVQAWIAEHDKWNIRLDQADRLQEIYRWSKILDIESLDRTLRWADKLGLTRGRDDAGPVTREFEDWPATRFCVYGHTHQFRHLPMGRSANREDTVYLNSGTWRPRVVQARDGKAFASYKEMTYLVFYRADEDLGTRSSKGASYELWHGIMKK
ncbi:MAG: hypothetical protein JXP73_15570 [Deltaproteobacteria bacterium]|jgi:UDP-2,3-diacylglucosamine pyrophosphatase LpxH|nr:hypothetical protein [Deltaproteobacteria bacterium]